MKKLISFMLVLTMLLSVAYVQVFAKNDDDSHREIASDANTCVVDGVTYTVIRKLSDFPTVAVAGGKYILANDIDCGGSTLAKKTIILGDKAILDGNGYSILNFVLSTSADDKGKSGLFTLASGGTYTIRNINFGAPNDPVDIDNNLALRSDDATSTTTVWENVEVYMNQTRDGGNPGAFISTAKGTHTFRYCDVYVYSSAIATQAASNLGGFVGTVADASTLTFEYCNVYGNMTSINNIGGYVGYVDQNKAATITFTGCTNNASLTTTAGNGVGGFIGYQRSATATVSFKDCVNNGVMTCVGATAKDGGVGGFIAYDMGAATTFENCTNTGSINGYISAGGFVGNSTGTLSFTGCLNRGKVSSVIDLEKIGSYGADVGGLAGRVGVVSFKDCTNIGTLTSTVGVSETKQYGCGNLAGMATTWSATGCYGFGTLVGANATKGVLYGVISDETGTTQDNKFILNSDNNENMSGAEAAGRVTAEGAAELLASRYSGLGFIVGDNGTPVIANSTLKAVQQGAVDTAAKTARIRLVGTVDSLNFNKAGFEYKISYTDAQGNVDTKTVSTTKAVGAINGKENNVSLSTSAEELGSAYLYTCVIEGIRTDVEATVTVTPITVSGTNEYRGETVTLTFIGGVLAEVN